MTRYPVTPGPLGRLLALVAGAVLLVVGFMFSLVLLTVVIVIGLAALGYFWWKTRSLRKAMRDRPPDGHVIEGEAVIVDESPDASRHLPPNEPPSNPGR